MLATCLYCVPPPTPAFRLSPQAWPSARRLRVALPVPLALVLSVMVPASAIGQSVVWNQRASALSSTQPDALAFDSTRDVSVYFQGDTGFGLGVVDTWEWNGADWTRRSRSGPSGRMAFAMAFDSARHVSVLFGGIEIQGSTTLFSDTWEWNEAGWTQRVVTGPSPRRMHAMAYDSARNVTVLFGGLDAAGTLAETWEWNGSDWIQRSVSGPSPRNQTAMAYDSARGVTVLFGGGGGPNGPTGDTWEWNGSAWSHRDVSGPPPRTRHAMAYDSARAVTVLFGGHNSGGDSLGDTWDWNGTAWTERLVAGPSARNGSAMAYDSTRGVTVLFGGVNSQAGSNGSLWELGVLCLAAPTITSQPTAQLGCPGAFATFSVVAEGSTVFTYQWRRNGTPIHPLANPTSRSASLFILVPRDGDPALYDCVVTNGCGSTTSTPASITLVCPQDFNCDGNLDPDDLSDYIGAYFSGCP